MNWSSNRCAVWRERICLLASGDLSRQEQLEVENHLAGCSGCRQFFAEAKTLTAGLAGWERHFAHVEPSPATRRRWAQAIRATAKAKTTPAHAPEISLRTLWRELIWPCRRSLAGMAALWLVMGAFHFGMPASRNDVAATLSPLPPGIRQTFEEQRQLLTELTQSAADEPAEPPRRNNPRPRSERPAEQKPC